MHRVAFASVLVALLAGCAGGDTEDEALDAVESDSGRMTFEGTVEVSSVEGGQELTRRGGKHEFGVPPAGWRNVVVTLEIHIDSVLRLLPPGCDAPADPCALAFVAEASTNEDPETFLVSSMAGGSWQVVIEPGEGSNGPVEVRGTVYRLTFGYIENQAS